MDKGRGGRLRLVASLFLLLGAVAVVTSRLLTRFTRYEVAGESMAPTLLPGDFVIIDRGTYRHAAPSPGDVVLAPDPREPTRTLVKRVAKIDAQTSLYLEGDNPAASTDSRHFGPVPHDAILGRARWRYWPLKRLGAVR